MSENGDTGQQKLVDWLTRPDTHGGSEVTHIETHISHVFLVGDRVYKLKKAIAPSFLDYMTVEKRKAAAETELRVNRRTAPEMYLSVQPVVSSGGSYTIGGQGDAVDWLVVMRRFDQSELFDRMASEGRLEATHVAGLADALADLHAKAEVRRDHGGAVGMHAHFRFPLDALEQADEARLPASRSELSRLADKCEAEWTRLAAKLDARRRHGRVRHGHGDLHLGNACLFGGRATPFDAVEFSEEIACTDMLYDASFTVMDLLAHGRRDYASLFLSRYLEAMRDYSGLACLNFFLAIRALVRAMASSFADKPERARRYFTLALDCIEAQHTGQLVAVGGFSGTGKSSLARKLVLDLAPGPGAVHLRSDGIRKRLFGRPPEATLPEDAYSEAWHRKTYRRLDRDIRRALRAGYPVLADATFTNRYSRVTVEKAAGDLGRPFHGIWLEAPADCLTERVAARRADASDAGPEVLARQLRAETGDVGWTRVSAAGTPEETYHAAWDVLATDMR